MKNKPSTPRTYSAEKVGPDRVLVQFSPPPDFFEGKWKFVLMEANEFEEYHQSRITFLGAGLILGMCLMLDICVLIAFLKGWIR